MSDVNRQIRERVEMFAAELEELVRQAALEAVGEALGGQAPRRSAGSGRIAVARGLPRAPGAKRSPAELETLKEDVRSYIRQNPGKGIERIAEGLGTSTRELNLPIKKLIAEGAVKTKGHKRATKYFPGSGAPRGRKKASKTRRRKK